MRCRHLYFFTASLIEHATNQHDVRCALNERRRDKVHAVLAAEVLQVVDVLRREHGDVDLHAREVAVLALAELG